MNRGSVNKTKTSFIIKAFLKVFLGLGFLIVIGTLGYIHLEGWNILDSLFMSVETLTTVGYGFVHPLSFHGKIFTISYIIIGVTLFLYYAAQIAQYIIMLNFEGLFKKRTMENKINKIKDHYIVCGYGRTGKHVVSALKDIGEKFVVVEKEGNDHMFEEVDDTFYILGDATDDETLKKVKIENAKGLFCSLHDDASNLYLTMVANDLNPNLNIVSRCIKSTNEQKFLKAGANKVILPYEMSARRMVTAATKPLLTEFLDVTLHMQQENISLKLEELKITRKTPFVNMTITESEIRPKTGVMIVVIKRGTEYITNPMPSEVFQEYDNVIIMGTGRQLDNFNATFKIEG